MTNNKTSLRGFIYFVIRLKFQLLNKNQCWNSDDERKTSVVSRNIVFNELMIMNFLFFIRIRTLTFYYYYVLCVRKYIRRISIGKSTE